VGSTSAQCDVLSGHCPCKKGFGGQSCHQCSLGYRSFPDCVPCGCDLRGTLPDTCDLEQGLCSCSEDGGTCSCKVLWIFEPQFPSAVVLLPTPGASDYLHKF
jgi:laminin alpha 1/2